MTTAPDRTRMRALWVFALASLLTIVLGAVTMAQADIPLGIWIRNSVAWLVAAAIAIFLASRGWLGAALPPLAVIVIALSFISSGQEGVHRWLDLGPVQLNAAALVLPAAVATLHRTPARRLPLYLAAIFTLLALQPDLSQLLAFVPAALLLAVPRMRARTTILLSIVTLLAIALCAISPNPLLPVPHVEGIFALALSQQPALAVVMGIALAATCLSPLLLPSTPELRGPGMALTGYFALTGAAFLLGAYPVPLAGYGLSFVIGWWLGFACLSVRGREPVNSLTSG